MRNTSRRLALATALFVAGACNRLPRSGLALADVLHGAASKPTGLLVVEVTKHGQIRVNGRLSSLDELAGAAKDSVPPLTPDESANEARILLRVDRNAPWSHVLLVRHALLEQGVLDVAYAARRGDSEAYVRGRIPGLFGHFAGDSQLRYIVRVGVELVNGVERYRFGDRVTGELAQVGSWVRE